MAYQWENAENRIGKRLFISTQDASICFLYIYNQLETKIALLSSHSQLCFPLILDVLSLRFSWREMAFQIHPLAYKRSDYPRPIFYSRHVQMLCIVCHRMPYAWEWRWYNMKNLNAASHEWDVIVLHSPSSVELVGSFFGFGQEGLSCR